MKRIFTLLCVALWLLHGSASAQSVGFSVLSIGDGSNPPIEAGVWYPTTALPRPTQVGLFTQLVAPDGAVKGTRLPLVVISHGNGGSFTGHSDTALALAKAGFVVAALTHPGDNFRDQSQALNVMDRPRQLDVLIDYMIAHWEGHTIDETRIGAFGFSSGGFTVLAAAGGDPDMRLITPHCEQHPAFFDCRLIAAHQPAGNPGSQPHIVHDHRIHAIAVAAPALGFTFTAQGLQNVDIPVQLWRAADDKILPSPFYVEAVQAALPRPPELHVVPEAGHFDFLAPCSDMLAHLAPVICSSEPGFNRAIFHQAFNAALVAFFKKALLQTTSAPDH